MKDMMTKNLFDVPSELPEDAPTVCPCFVVTNFKCPATRKGRLLESCLGKAFQACPNYSAWWHYKRAEVMAKLNKPSD